MTTLLDAALARLEPRRPLLAAAQARLDELACHDASCAPPPVGTGGSKPAAKGGGKLGSLSPKGGDRGVIPQTNQSAGRMSMADVKDVYEVDLGGGVTTTVTDVSQGSDQIVVYGDIEFESGGLVFPVGSFERTLKTDDGGRLVAEHDILKINVEFQGQGIGRNFTDHTLAQYERLGVDRIELETGLDVGAYAWARQGYRYDESRSATSRHEWVEGRLDLMADRARRDVLNERVTDDDYRWLSEQIAEVRYASSQGKDVQPIHVASIGHGDSAWERNGSWPGKGALLKNEVDWDDPSDSRDYKAVYYLEGS